MANVGGGGGGGRKRRSVEPSHAGPKKLSPIAARALAALEGDSSESEDEDDGSGQQQKAYFSPPSTEIRPSLGRKDQPTTSGVDPDDFIVEEEEEEEEEEEKEECVIELDDDSSAGSEDEERGRAGQSNGAAAAGADQSESNHRPKKARVAPIIHQAARAHETTPARGDTVERLGVVPECQPADGSPTADEDAGTDDEDIVLPHAPTSKYSDVLSSFLSTAFDDKAMLVLHKSKEGIPLNRGSPRKQDFGRWASSQRDRVPIVPQMQYRKSKGASTGLSTQDANPTSSTAIINAEISSFLVEEGRKLVSSPVPMDAANGMIGAPLQIHQQPWQRFDARNGVQHTDPTQQMPPQQMQQFAYQPTAPHYYPANHGYNIPQQQYLTQWNQGYQQNGWQYAQPTHPTDMAAATPHAHNAAASASTAVPGGQYGPPTATTTGRASVVHGPISQLPQQLKPQTASASAPIRLTSTNKEVIAKFPVAFAYWPDDEASRKNALSAASEWDAQGKSAARKNAKLASAKKPESNRNASTPDGRRDITKRNPTTPPSEPAGSDFPPGWTIKTFERTSSTPGKTSKYKVFYPPGGKAKFRSKKSALIFVDILKEPGIDGEKRAFEVFKSRGHKL